MSRTRRSFFLPWRRALRLSLALQGGGAHGAFTWGVLDRLLEAGVRIDAVSGTSAGACNAVVLAHGLLEGGPEGAREALAALWYKVAERARKVGFLPEEVGAFALGLATHLFSPYQLNPLGIDPLRDILTELVDFERVRRSGGVRVLIAATAVRTGEGRIFQNGELTAQAVLASACLPQIHRAVEIDGELYWDGGYTSNPPLVALAAKSRVRDLLLVRINPIESPAPPHTAAGIRTRVAEVVFGRPLALELEQLREARRVAAWARLADARLRRLARIRLHVIDGDEPISRLPPTTRLLPNRTILEQLRDDGRAAAEAWLERR